MFRKFELSVKLRPINKAFFKENVPKIRIKCQTQDFKDKKSFSRTEP